MKSIVSVMIVLAIASRANANWVIDDFEGYSVIPVRSVWVPNSNISSETIETMLNSKCMLIQTPGGGVGPAQTTYTMPGAVIGVHGANLTYPGFDSIKMTFAVPPNNTAVPWGNLGGTGGNVFMSMFDC
jgi:hypothetical protein